MENQHFWLFCFVVLCFLLANQKENHKFVGPPKKTQPNGYGSVLNQESDRSISILGSI